MSNFHFDRYWRLLNDGHKVLAVATRSDGHVFYLTEKNGTRRIIAGCQNQTVPEFRKHARGYVAYFKRLWVGEKKKVPKSIIRNYERKSKETLALIDQLVACADGNWRH